ncbi:MAG: Cof-type HAD-IIB family hydrolase [Clostridiaceae bacterium]
MDKKVIFFDIDGTLSDSMMGVPESAYESIRVLKENRHMVFINTGRTRDMIQDDVITMGFDGIIAGGGSHIEFRDKILLESYIPASTLKKVIQALEENEISYSLESRDKVYMTKSMADYLTENVKILRGKLNSEMQKMMDEREKIQYADTMREFDINTAQISKICFICYDIQQVQLIRKSVGNEFQLISHESPCANLFNGEIVMKGFNRGSAVKKICEYLNISKKNTVAFGDSMNDIDLLEVVGHGVAMGNAIDALKEKAKSICESAAEDGIYKELKRMQLI